MIDGGRVFVEWVANFDCDVDSMEARTVSFRDAIAGWLELLRRALVRAGV